MNTRSSTRDIFLQSLTLPDLSNWRTGHPPGTFTLCQRHDCHLKNEPERTTLFIDPQGPLLVPFPKSPKDGVRHDSSTDLPYFDQYRPGPLVVVVRETPSTFVTRTVPDPHRESYDPMGRSSTEKTRYLGRVPFSPSGPRVQRSKGPFFYRHPGGSKV